jgi:hypothetical protein
MSGLREWMGTAYRKVADGAPDHCGVPRALAVLATPSALQRFVTPPTAKVHRRVVCALLIDLIDWGQTDLAAPRMHDDVIVSV